MLLAHAATLSMRKRAFRRAALWYLFAATKLEKSGIKPLTTYFLQRTRELYQSPPEKNLSPSFWDAEGITPTEQAGFDAILPGIEHALGRLHYTTGDTKGAVQFFLGLLRGSTNLVHSALSVGVANGYAVDTPKSMISDKVFLEDFRVAFQHFLDTSADSADLSEMKLPVTFCVAKQTRVRLPGESVGGNATVWDKREETWRSYWKSQGKEGLQSTGKAPVNEMFRVDVSLHNPLDVDINLSDVTIVVREAQSETDSVSADFVEVEALDDIVLSANETRTIPIAVKATRSAKLQVSRASYKFLSILPASESLATRGRRLQDTALQRQSKMYAPDTFIAVDVEDASQRLSVNFVEDQRLVLAQGECKRMRLWASNVGTDSIDDVWLVSGDEDEIFLDGFNDAVASASTEILHSNNSLNPHVDPWEDRVDSAETLKFVSRKLQGLIRGEDTEISDPPPIELICSHTPEQASPRSVISSDITRFIHQRRRNFTANTLTANHPDVLRQLHSSVFPLYNPFSVDILIFWSLPTEQREGHLLVPGLTLGARHGELNKMLDEAAEAKVKRSMYAETQREKSAVLEAIRVSEWNAEMNPIVVALRDMMIVEHDFSDKPCHVSIDFTLRNLSLTHPCKYKLVLPSQTLTNNSPGEFSQPTYAGRLTYRGSLKPLESVTLQPTIHVTRPDTYALGSWRVETEVFDPSTPSHEPGAKLPEPQYRYVQVCVDASYYALPLVALTIAAAALIARKFLVSIQAPIAKTMPAIPFSEQDEALVRQRLEAKEVKVSKLMIYPIKPGRRRVSYSSASIDDLSVHSFTNIDGYVAQPHISTAADPTLCSTVLSRFLGRSVHLAYKGPRLRPAPPTWSEPALKAHVDYHDAYPLLVASVESLAGVRDFVKQWWNEQGITAVDNWDPDSLVIERFRPNIVFEGAGLPFAEDMWKEVTTSDPNSKETGRFSLVSKCTRCMVCTPAFVDQIVAYSFKQLPNIDPATGARNMAIPSKPLKQFRTGLDPGTMDASCFGCNAVPAAPGTLHVGDFVAVNSWGVV
ncbi:hypothetical protein EWM64_g4249 [Hericium alpestre]|uniref:MOSC domain-containing protein n=1 Tax=Hericium alpestre TaxID=135208 RepID=A0A4Y9ZY71_9AGAM|nr:hypothetical protein EWM64_g4249 [Hericium alpestre]